MGFWQNVVDECEYKGISRKELAYAVHFSVNTISSGIKRNGIPDADLALRIAKALNVPLEKLLSAEKNHSEIDTEDYMKEKSLFKMYLPYIQKMEEMTPSVKNAILTIIESYDLHQS